MWAIGDETLFSLLKKCFEMNQRLGDAIPAQLNKDASRFQAGTVLDGEKSDKILELIAELKDSKTVLVSYNVNDPNAGLSNTRDLSRFKMFLCDTGLFV